MENTFYPSLADFSVLSAVNEGLVREFQEGRQVHAYLFLGPRGIGKKTFSNRLGQILFCTDAKKPCGICGGCTRFLHGVHQDVLTVDDDKMLTVDVIRSLIETVGTATFEGGNRAVYLPHADRMNQAAQNCLLKTLEEPPRGTVFFLMAEDESKLLPTIISRCRVVRMAPLNTQQIQEALKRYRIDDAHHLAVLSRGIIGQAIEMAGNDHYRSLRETVLLYVFQLNKPENVIRSVNALVAKKSKNKNGEKSPKNHSENPFTFNQVLDVTEDILHRLMLSCVIDEELPDDIPERWKNNAKPSHLHQFRRMLEALFKTRQLLENQVNPQAAAEQFLYSILEETEKW